MQTYVYFTGYRNINAVMFMLWNLLVFPPPPLFFSFFFFFFGVHHDDLHAINMSEKTVKLENNILKLIALHWFQLLLVHSLRTITKLLKLLFDPLNVFCHE